MEIKISMLNVGDADAIIVELEKDKQSLVMVIDGGRIGDYPQVKASLIPILKTHGKPAPDIVVCTHYDRDHIGGLLQLLREYNDGIQKVWVHRIPETMQMLSEERQLQVNVSNLSHVSRMVNMERELVEAVNDRSMILESIRDLKKLEEIVDKSKIMEVFYRDRPLDNWQEIVILGPRMEYFNRLFPKAYSDDFLEEDRKFTQLIENAPLMRVKRNAGLISNIVVDDISYSAQLTATNRASIIIGIDINKKRFLFTGDAGVESFKDIPNWKTELENLHFLKVPHHGSKNNLSRELIDVMKPRHAFISGSKRQSDEIVQYLTTVGAYVQTTKSGTDLHYPAT